MTWIKLADEGQTVTVAPDTLVRYGVSSTENYIERVMSGTFAADNSTFGDPMRGVEKSLWGLAAPQGELPDPQPGPAPSPPPANPSEPSMLTTIVIPPHPGPAPAADATWQVWDIYVRRLGLHVQALQAQVKHEDEAACVAAQLETAAAMREAGKITEFVFPKKTRADLVWDALKSLPQVTAMTELNMVQTAERTADAYLARHPQS
jgi:hypothetical protein